MMKTKPTCINQDCNNPKSFGKKGYCSGCYAKEHPLKRSRPRQKSEKTAQEDIEIQEHKAELIKKYRSTCQGCGRTVLNEKFIHLSHLVRKGKRTPLRALKLNHTLHCCNCHENWDSNNILRMWVMFDFYSNLEKIKQMDASRYNALIIKLDEAGLNSLHLGCVEIVR